MKLPSLSVNHSFPDWVHYTWQGWKHMVNQSWISYFIFPEASKSANVNDWKHSLFMCTVLSKTSVLYLIQYFYKYFCFTQRSTSVQCENSAFYFLTLLQKLYELLSSMEHKNATQERSQCSFNAINKCGPMLPIFLFWMSFSFKYNSNGLFI